MGWVSVEDLVRLAFDRSRVVMVNEAHNVMARCVRTREVGVRVVRIAHELGVRRLAMEALPCLDDGSAGPIREVPTASWGGYLTQPDMQRLVATALDLGWDLWAYEMPVDAGLDPGYLASVEFANVRDRAQADNLDAVRRTAPDAPLLVWCGGDHAAKTRSGGWTRMGYHFRELSGIEHFVIDQNVSVAWPDRYQPWLPDLLARLDATLQRFGGTAGILRAEAPEPWHTRIGVDAVIASTDNRLT